MNHRIMIAALLTLGLVACSDDFLELPSETNLTTTTFFKTQGDFEKAVNGAYAPLRDLYRSGANSGTGAWIMGEMHSDNTFYLYSASFRATSDPEQIASFIYDPASAAATQRYQTDYLVIARANQIISQIDKIEFDAAIKSNLKGQALFLRALSYFDLVQYFGELPLHLEPATSLSDVALPLSSVEKIYEQIIADATAAAGLLPLKSAQQAGRATSGAANTLLGNAYIVIGEHDDAEVALKKVVNSNEYSLLPSYADVFRPANKNSSESVFEVQYLEGTGGFASNFTYSFFPQPISAAELTTLMGNFGVTPTNVQALTQEAFNVPTPNLIAAYEDGDEREDASIGYGIAHGLNFPFVRKYLHPHTAAGITNDNWPVYRYSEVLLLLAEALHKQGKSTEALTHLNEVRNRAELGDIVSTANLSDVILHERRIELAFENKRWLDLVRAGKVTEVISAYGAEVKADPQAYYFPVGVNPFPSAFTDFRTVFPKPASEALLSPYF